MLRGLIKNNIPLLSMIIIFVIDFILIFTTHLNWNNSMTKYLPLKSNIQYLKSDISTAHLWLEEVIAGDKYIDIDIDIIEKFKHKRFEEYLTKSKDILIDDNDLHFYEKLLQIEYNSEQLLVISNERLADINKHNIGSKLDQVFDSKFKEIIVLIDELNSLIDKRLSDEFTARNSYFTFILTIFLLVNILVFILLYKTKKRNIKYQDELYEEKKRAEITLYSIGDAVITTDANGYIIFLNPIAQSLTGYSLDEAKGVYLDEVFDIYNQHSNKKVKSPVKRVLQEGIIIGLANHTVLKSRDGIIYPIEDSAAPIKDEEGHVLGAVLVFHDVTEEVKLRNKLSSNEKMMMEQSKLASMGEMLENIAHQWRQPLSTITTAASGLKVEKEYGLLKDDTFNKSIDVIIDSSNSLSKTIDDFRDFFKPNNEKVLFYINTIISNALSIISSKFQFYEVKVINNCENIEINSFATELLQIFNTILNNSNDEFIKRNNKNNLVFIDVYKKENKAIIKIKDNAGGMKESIMHRIFEPYFTTKHQSLGKGLGLFMVQEIITKHMNGRINVVNSEYEYKNNKYKGLEFTIELYQD